LAVAEQGRWKATHKRAVAAQATKLDDTMTPEHYEAVSDTHVSLTDPDAMRPNNLARHLRACLSGE